MIEQNTVLDKRSIGLDIMRGVAIFLVVLYHNILIPIAGIEGFWYYFNLIIKSLMAIAMPIFFFLSGYFLMKKGKIDLAKHYKKLIISALAFVFWSIVFTAIFAAYREEKLAAGEFFRIVFFLKHDWNNSLWFLYAYLGLNLIYPFVLWLYQKYFKIYMFFVILFGVVGYSIWMAYDISNLIFSFNNNASVQSVADTLSKIFNITNQPCYVITNFLIGGVFNRYIHNLTKKCKIGFGILGVVCFVLLVVNNAVLLNTNVEYPIVWNNYPSWLSTIIVMAMFVNLVGLKTTTLRKILGVFGKYSFGIYIFHWILEKLLRNSVLQVSVPVEFIGLFSIALSLGYCVVSAICSIPFYKFRYTKFLFLK